MQDFTLIFNDFNLYLKTVEKVSFRGRGMIHRMNKRSFLVLHK